MTCGAEAEDWCEGVRGLTSDDRLTRASWKAGWRSVVRALHRGAGGASEDGGRRYRPQRAGRPPGAPEGRALDDAGHSGRKVADQIGHSKISMTQDVYLGRKVANPEAAEDLERFLSADHGSQKEKDQ